MQVKVIGSDLTRLTLQRNSYSIFRASKPSSKGNLKSAGTLMSSQAAMSAHNNESMGEVLPGLWVGNLMSVSKLLQTQAAPPHLHLTITIISVLSNQNLIRLATDILEQYRLKQGTDDVNSATCIRHEVIELKDLAESDLLLKRFESTLHEE